MAFNQDPPRLKAPAGTCDTHMHIYDGRYPTAPTRHVHAARCLGGRLSQGAGAARHHAHRRGAALDLRHRQPLHARGHRGAGRQRARHRRGRPERDRRRARPPHQGRHPRHPLPHAAGRRAAVGHPGDHGGAGRQLRLACAASARRPHPARPRAAVEEAPRHAGGRSRRQIPRAGAGRPSGLSRCCCACSKTAAPG